MTETLRVLLVEDSEDDAALTLRQLRNAGYDVTYKRVDTADAMRNALETDTWDIILSDFNMPQFSGPAALSLMHAYELDLPFIIVSGAIGEETATELMRTGAHDYIMKDNLMRLIPAIERELREAEIRHSKHQADEDLQLAAKVFESSREGIIITDSHPRILRVNKAFCDITGFNEGEILGKNPSILKSGIHDDDFYRSMWLSIRDDGYWHGEVWNRRKGGEIFPVWESISAVKNEEGIVTHYVSGFTDLSHQKQAEEHIQYLMHYDALTDLPNRTLFKERFKQFVVRARTGNKRVAFLHLDLDRFINVNDTLGHKVGDQLLQQVGQRLVRGAKNNDIVSRFSGDEFVIGIPDLMMEEDVRHHVQLLVDVFTEPFYVIGHEIFLAPSIGVALYPDDSDNFDELVRFADTALHVAKAKGGASYQFYEKSMNADASERLSMENALRRAIEREEFQLHYQPQISMITGRMIGVEALLRWQRSENGMVLPGQFIPLLEETGLIIPVGEWVLRQACADLKQWMEINSDPVQIALNLSPRQFRDKGLILMIHKVLGEYGVNPSLIELEITESSVMEDPEFTLQTLHACHESGIRTAIDDFGTGYSSLSHLKRFPLDVLKIDQSFVADIPGDDDDEAIVDAIIGMAHRLNLQVIAEGVETEAQVRFLRDHGCDNAQGYHFSRPVRCEEITAMMTKEKED